MDVSCTHGVQTSKKVGVGTGALDFPVMVVNDTPLWSYPTRLSCGNLYAKVGGNAPVAFLCDLMRPYSFVRCSKWPYMEEKVMQNPGS